MAAKIEISKEDIEQCVEAGMTQEEMAAKYDCAVITIKKRMQKYGIGASRGRTAAPVLPNTVLEEIKSEIAQLSKKVEQQGHFVLPASILGENVIASINDDDKSGNYRIDGSNLILMNSVGDVNIAAGSFGVMKTGLSVNVSAGHLILLQALPGEQRGLTVVNSVVAASSSEIEVILANYNVVDSCYIAQGSPIAQLSIIKKSQISWVLT